MTELRLDELRKSCDPESLQYDDIARVKPLDTIIGQDRAVRALNFGLGHKAKGYNVYVSGDLGTGKVSAVKLFLKKLAGKQKASKDICYVNNFDDPYYPRVLTFDAGRAKDFKEDMKEFIDEARSALIKVFESDEYSNKQSEILKEFDTKRNEIFKQVNEKAREHNFIIKQTHLGIIALPVVDGDIIDEEAFNSLSQEEREKIASVQEELQAELKSLNRPLRKLEKNVNQALNELEKQVALFAINAMLEELRDTYKDLEQVIHFLEDVKKDILKNLKAFLKSDEKQPSQKKELPLPGKGNRILNRYEVNVFVDNSDSEGAPLIIELNPTYNNLFGRIEKETDMGSLVTDFTLIRPGALHLANGGYLVIPADEILRNYFSYDSLKRALKTGKIEMEDISDRLGWVSTKSLHPEPIPMNLQVVLIGESYLYYLLYQLDPDFKELFKIKAEFDTTMALNAENMHHYLRFIRMICEEEDLLPYDRKAIAKVIEQGIRLAGDQNKLSTRFGELSDLIRESSFYAQASGESLVRDEYVQQAIEEKEYRSNLIQEKVMEMITNKTILLDIEGEKTGQVNGLAVLSLGDLAFGKPNRITVSTRVGKAGIIDIEREAKLSGPIHTKGVMILSGFLSERFGQHHPITLSASVVFEQSYGEIEGDSASSTELYALLSSLSGVPLKQGIAVTGSVNQKGEVQAIGGVNEKIEGYFEVCSVMGLNGQQGVMIPAANVKHLMLKEKVVEAVKAGTFNIWTVQTIDEGMEILTGRKSGKLLKGGKYEKDSINDLVSKRLQSLAEKLLRFSKDDKVSKSSKAKKRS